MAKETKSADDVVARGADVPLALASQAQTRDALTDPREGDIIPDVDTKGYHVGEIRQPAEPVLTRSGDVTFESLPEAGESKFVSSYAEEQAAMDKRLSSDPAYAGVAHQPIASDPEEAERNFKAAQSARSTSRSGASETSKLDSDSAKVAGAQAAEDKR
jgi:hypothetical protein